MRPRRLTVTAFGPFPGTEEVDFARLDGRELVLIDGPTGAGKTTLLDALCFALYGEVPGARRAAKQPELRCAFAEGKRLAEVVLDFELGGRLYRARRVPGQERPRARGTGTTTQAPQASLTEVVEGREVRQLAAGVEAVDAAVGALLGLSVEQFKQVLLLPQGEFRQFLLAPSKEKEALLEHLFGTTLYRSVAEELAEARLRLEAGAREGLRRREDLLAQAGVPDEAGLRARAEGLEAQAAALEAAAREAGAALAAAEEARARGEALAARFRAREAAREGLSRVEAERARAEADRALLALHAQAAPLGGALARVEAEARRAEETAGRRGGAARALALAAEGVAAADAALARLPALTAQLESLRAQDGALQVLAPVEAEAARAAAAGREASGREARARAALTAAEARLASAREALRALEERLARAQGAGAEAPQLAEAALGARELLRRRTELEALRERARGEARADAQAREALAAAEEAARQAAGALARARAARESGLAAELAAGLSPGAPCPVCGGTEHPAPARAAGEVVARERVEGLAQAEAAALAAVEAARERAAATRQAAEVTKEHGRALRAELGTSADTPLAEVQARAEAAAQAARAAREAHEAAQSLAAERTRATEAAGRAEAAREEARAAAQGAAGEAEVARARLEELQRQLEGHLGPGESVEGRRAAVRREKEAAAEAAAAVEAGKKRADEALAAARAAEEAAAREEAEQGRVLAEAREALARGAREAGLADPAAVRRALLAPERHAALRAAVEAFEARAAAAAAALAEAEGAVAGQAPPDVAALAAAARSAGAAQREAAGALAEARAAAGELGKVAALLGERQRELAALEAELSVLGRLAQVVAGENGRRMSLQRFVLASRMDEVAVAASQRLLRMSRGRYELQRTDDVQHKGRSSGLDLKVMDRHTGVARFVHSLSGGEMFLASLSLALGLADVVMRRSGGVRLDALFIDEGFGTLDDETLDMVVRTLEDLRAGGRLVGLISHVSELKERIPTRLTVTKGPRGSTVALSV